MADTHDEKASGFESTQAFLTVHRSVTIPGNLMYIILDNRAAFDLIDLPEDGNEKVRHKAIQTETQYLIFQFWLDHDFREDGAA
jgi:hypothetical protein